MIGGNKIVAKGEISLRARLIISIPFVRRAQDIQLHVQINLHRPKFVKVYEQPKHSINPELPTKVRNRNLSSSSSYHTIFFLMCVQVLDN